MGYRVIRQYVGAPLLQGLPLLARGGAPPCLPAAPNPSHCLLLCCSPASLPSSRLSSAPARCGRGCLPGVLPPLRGRLGCTSARVQRRRLPGAAACHCSVPPQHATACGAAALAFRSPPPVDALLAPPCFPGAFFVWPRRSSSARLLMPSHARMPLNRPSFSPGAFLCGRRSSSA